VGFCKIGRDDVAALLGVPHAATTHRLHPVEGNLHFASLSISRIYSFDGQVVSPRITLLDHIPPIPETAG
jgi:hypothetical protein